MAKQVSHPVKGTLTYSERDAFGLIQVIDTPTTRSLYFDSPVEQSRLYFQAPMTLAFEYQQMMLDRVAEFGERHAIGSTLMLGLGGGSLTNHLHCMYPKAHHRIVELRQSVIDIAKHYFYLAESETIEPLQANALEYVEQAEPADVILVDVYNEHAMPDEFSRESFLENLVQLKPAKGVIVFNLWASTPEDTLKVIQFWERQSRYHIQIHQTQSSGNVILTIK